MSWKSFEKKAEISRRVFIVVAASFIVLAGTVILGCREIETSNIGPLLYAPTSDGISCNMVVEEGRELLEMALCRDGESNWISVAPKLIGQDVIEWHATGLSAGSRYSYQIRKHEPSEPTKELFKGGFSTRPKSGTSFTFDLITDSHLFVRDFTEEEIAEYPLEDAVPLLTDIYKVLYTYWRAEAITKLTRIARNVYSDSPDFLIHLGDVMDFHGFAHNPPSPDSRWTRKGYLEYRKLLGELAFNTAHMSTIGNWDGENGWFTEEEIDRSRSQRLLYLPTPGPDTYAEGGGMNSDYYAFQWGDALFVILNVMSYTPKDHPWKKTDEGADTWSLGVEQLAWLEDTLKNSTSKWKFICAHHPAGGNGGSAQESVYGRGGGRAAYVGEQALVHQLMLDYGVQIFFYGHDHVFSDMVVDGIHYTLPGSAGAPNAWKFGSSATGYPHLSYQVDSGHARVRVTPDKVVVEFVNETGAVIGSYEIT